MQILNLTQAHEVVINHFNRDIEEKNTQGESPLHEAIRRRLDLQVIQALIQVGAPVNMHKGPNNDGPTPVFEAIARENREIIHMLIRAGADLNIREKLQNQTPIDFAIANRFNQIACYIIQNFGWFQDSNLQMAIQVKNTAIIERLMKMRYGLNYIYKGDYDKEIAFNEPLLEVYHNNPEIKSLLMAYPKRQRSYQTKLMSQPGHPPELYLVPREQVEARYRLNRGEIATLQPLMLGKERRLP